MRSNLPITNVEYVLKDDEAPTSRTDIHGNITYVNQDFLNISGFSEAELLGQPDEIIQQNAAVVEQAAAASESMKVQADKLAQLVASFKLMKGKEAVRRAGVKPLPGPARLKAVPGHAAARTQKLASFG